jgi:hypothetical protein
VSAEEEIDSYLARSPIQDLEDLEDWDRKYFQHFIQRLRDHKGPKLFIVDFQEVPMLMKIPGCLRMEGTHIGNYRIYIFGVPCELEMPTWISQGPDRPEYIIKERKP